MKTNRILCAILALCLAILPAVSLAEADRSITVTGTATVKVEADSAVLSLGVETAAKEASAAAAANAEEVDAVIKALVEAGINEEDITTNYYFVNAIYNYEEMNEDGVARIRGYRVSNSLSVTVHDIDKVGEIIDIALASGANSCDNISFKANGEDLYDQVLAAAVKEAARKAAVVAEAAGGKLGKVVSVTEQYGSYSGVLFDRAAVTEEAAFDAGFAKAAGTAIRSDNLSYSATVVVTFELTD